MRGASVIGSLTEREEPEETTVTWPVGDSESLQVSCVQPRKVLRLASGYRPSTAGPPAVSATSGSPGLERGRTDGGGAWLRR